MERLLDIFIADYNVFFAVSVALLLAWFVHVHRKNRCIKQLEQTEQESRTQLLLLQDRYTELCKQDERGSTQLERANEHSRQSHAELAALKQDGSNKREIINRGEQERKALQQRLDLLQQEYNAQENSLTKLQVEFEQEQKNSFEKLAILEGAKSKLSHEFKLLANQIFEDKQHKFSLSSREALENIIKPMQKDMLEFRARIEQVHKDDIEAGASLRSHLSQLEKLNQQMSTDATNLTHALKGESKSQGNWGEMILEKILASSGLREGVDFKREQSFTTENGKRQRPDVIIYLPDNKHIIIDSKVSLTHYEQAISAKNDDGNAKSSMKLHMQSIKNHIRTLAEKRYDQIDGLHSPDYTLMFMPIEAAYLMAIEIDSSVFEDAFSRGVAVVTPSTLYATLKLIEQLWRYEKQSENVAKLINHTGKLHDKVVGFIESFEDVGKKLGQAQNAYDKAFGQIRTGRGNIVSQIKTLGDLSGKAQKDIPEHLLDDGQSSITFD